MCAHHVGLTVRPVPRHVEISGAQSMCAHDTMHAAAAIDIEARRFAISHRILVLLIGLCSCGDNQIPRDSACQDQADVWCKRVGYPHTGCESIWEFECGLASDYIDSEAQAQCIHDMQTLRRDPFGSWVEPCSCLATWSSPRAWQDHGCDNPNLWGEEHAPSPMLSRCSGWTPSL